MDNFAATFPRFRAFLAAICLVTLGEGLSLSHALAENEPEISLNAKPPSPRPELVNPATDVWPFVKWSYAKAYTFNFFPIRAETLLGVNFGSHWNKHIRSVQLINRDQAKSVTDLVNKTKGTYETSKCFFPRHGILYFDRDDKPVAAVNVCFECEGLRAWPDFEMSWEKKYGTYDEKTDKEIPGINVNFESILDGYKSLFKQIGEEVDYEKVYLPK